MANFRLRDGDGFTGFGAFVIGWITYVATMFVFDIRTDQIAKAIVSRIRGEPYSDCPPAANVQVDRQAVNK